MSLNIAWLKMSVDYENLIKGVFASLAMVFDDSTKQIKPIRSKIFNIEYNNDASRVHYKGVSGVERLKPTAEGQQYPQLNLYLGHDTTFIFDKFTWMVSITEEAVADNTWRTESNEMKKLARSADAVLESSAFSVLNGAFSTAETYGWFKQYRMNDGKALLSWAHPMANWSTASNVLTDSAPLSTTSLTRLRSLLLLTPTESGEPMDFSSGFTLVVPNWDMADLAMRIVGSNNLQGTANNDINTLSGISVVSSSRLASQYGWSDTAYFLVANEDNGLMQIIREAPVLSQSVDEKTWDLNNNIKTRFASWYRDWRGVAGSRGDSITYAG